MLSIVSMASSIELYSHQKAALRKLHPGAVLYGGVGSGKTLTALAYYKERWSHLDLYVITTAKKRGTGDWQEEASLLGVNELTVDSWNNIQKYIDVKNAMFIFDEQRLVGYGSWVKSFLKLSKYNKWILLTGTPGDTWIEYMPIFVANGYYKHKTDFINQHVEYDRFSRYPKIKRYHNEGKLNAYRQEVLVTMAMERHTKRHRYFIEAEYDKDDYNRLSSERWNIFENQPIRDAGELARLLRNVVNSSDDRKWLAKWLISLTDRIIVFYNFNYELYILREICEELGKTYSEYNGLLHEEIPEGDNWAYLVNYTAGAEGWNCIETDTIFFYSMNYSYKQMEQAEGRIDRLNTSYIDLHYYYGTSNSSIDKSILKALRSKKKFNARAWAKGEGYEFRA